MRSEPNFQNSISLNESALLQFLELVQRNLPLPTTHCIASTQSSKKATIKFNFTSINGLTIDPSIWESLRGVSKIPIHFFVTLTWFNSSTGRVHGKSFTFTLGQVMKSGKDLTGSEDIIFWIDDNNRLAMDNLPSTTFHCYADPFSSSSILLCELALKSEAAMNASIGWSYFHLTEDCTDISGNIYEGSLRSIFLFKVPVEFDKEDLKKIPDAHVSFKINICVGHEPLFLHYSHENTFLLDPNAQCFTTYAMTFSNFQLLNVFELVHFFFPLEPSSDDIRLCFGVHNTIKFISQIYKAYPISSSFDLCTFPIINIIDFVSHPDVYLVFWVECQMAQEWVTIAWSLAATAKLEKVLGSVEEPVFQIELFSRPFFPWTRFLCGEETKSLFLSFESDLSNDSHSFLKKKEEGKCDAFKKNKLDDLCFSFNACDFSLPPLLPQANKIQKSPIPKESAKSLFTLNDSLVISKEHDAPTYINIEAQKRVSHTLSSFHENEIQEKIDRKPSFLYAFSNTNEGFKRKSHYQSSTDTPFFIINESDTLRTFDSEPHLSRADSFWSTHSTSVSRTISTSSGSTLHTIPISEAYSTFENSLVTFSELQVQKLLDLPFAISILHNNFEEDRKLDLRKEISDPYLINELSLLFIGYKPASDEQEIKSLKLAFDFYFEEAVETPELFLQCIDKELFPIFQDQTQPCYGFLKSFSIDLAMDFPLNMKHSLPYFLEYLRSTELEVQIWNILSPSLKGIAKLPLVHFLRQGETNISTLLMAPVLGKNDVTQGFLYYMLSNSGELHPNYRSWRDVAHCKHGIQEVYDYHYNLGKTLNPCKPLEPILLISEPHDFSQDFYFTSSHPVAQRAKLLATLSEIQELQFQSLPSLIHQHIYQQRTSFYTTNVLFRSEHVFEFIVTSPLPTLSEYLLVIDHPDVNLLMSTEDLDHYAIDSFLQIQTRFKKMNQGYLFVMEPNTLFPLPFRFTCRTYAPEVTVLISIHDPNDLDTVYCALKATFCIQLPAVRTTWVSFTPIDVPFSSTYPLDTSALSIQSTDLSVQCQILEPGRCSIQTLLPSSDESLIKKTYLMLVHSPSLPFCIKLILFGYPLLHVHCVLSSPITFSLKLPSVPIYLSTDRPDLISIPKDTVSPDDSKIELSYHSLTLEPREILIHCLEKSTKNLIGGWILKLETDPPKVSKTFKVQLPTKRPIPKRIKFRNVHPTASVFNVQCTHSQLIQLKEQELCLNTNEEIYLHFCLLPAELYEPIVVYIFIREEKGLYEECFSINITREI